MKIQKLCEEKGQPRSSRYTKYFNRIKRALEKGDEETLQRTKEAIMYAPSKELKNSEASELMDMIKNKKITESVNPSIDLTIPYDDLEVTFYGKQRDVDVFDADQERTIDYDYDPDEGTVIEQIMDYLVEEDDSFDAMSGDELEDYVKTNLEDLFNKYYDKLKEYFRDSASEQASETIDIDQYDDDRRDWDAMPGGHDWYDESLNETPSTDPYGLSDVKRMLNNRAPEYWWVKREIEMDFGDGDKLASYLSKKGVDVKFDSENEMWFVKGRYHFSDCYFYPYEYAHEEDAITESTTMKVFGAKAKKLNESENYKVKFFQVFEAPKSPKENGKMIGQRGTLDDANAFGKEKAGEGNYIIKAVCTDGKTRPIDNDTEDSDYQMEEDFGFKSGDRYYGDLPSEPSALEYGAAFSRKETDFEELVSYTKDLANETKATGCPVESYEEFRKIIRDQYGYVHPSTTDKLWEIYMDTFDSELDESAQDVQYGVHSFSQDAIIFRGTEEECGKYIDSHKELWDDAEVYRMTPDDPHYLKEDIQDDAYTAQRYLDMELPGMLDHIISLIPNLREVEIRNIISASRKFYALLEGIAARHSDVVKESLDESLFEDVEVETKAGPEEGPEFGLSSLLNQAIQDEFKTIDMYNSLAVTAKEEGFEDIVAVIDEINTEENKHVGQLQEILKTVSPNAEAIEAGEVEGAEQIVDESINNSNSSPNNINEGDADMTERAKEIYNSFKEIEKELNGDGEAITAVIDKLYDDNREDPDYKIAWTKWADGE